MRSVSAPSFIYFDLGNVLLTFDHMVACRQMGEVAGLSADRVYEIVFGGDLEYRYERGEISRQEFHERFCEAAGSRPHIAELEHAASAIFHLNLRIVPLVAALAAAGRRLGILSNICPSHWDYVGHGRYGIIPELFETTALSFQIGAMKPEPEIYRAAAELAGVPPQEVFFTDDRPEHVQGAREAGFDAVRFTTAAALAGELRRRGLRFNY